MPAVKLAEALLRRKELNEKVDQLKKINVDGLFVIKVKRQSVSDSVDEVTAAVPKISAKQISAAFDYYAKNLRMIDAAIQRANWETNVDVGEDTFKDFVDPYVTEDNIQPLRTR